MEVVLLSYVKSFAGPGFVLNNLRVEIKARKVKLHISFFDLFLRKQRWFVEEKRVHNTQPNYSFLFAISHAHVVKTCLQGFEIPLTLTLNLK